MLFQFLIMLIKMSAMLIKLKSLIKLAKKNGLIYFTKIVVSVLNLRFLLITDPYYLLPPEIDFPI